jgi:Group II intron, maturase-specific domain
MTCAERESTKACLNPLQHTMPWRLGQILLSPDTISLEMRGWLSPRTPPSLPQPLTSFFRPEIRGWRLQLKNDKSLADLSAMFAPILKGWSQYYGRFHGSALKSVWRNMNRSLIRWLMRKHKRLSAHKTRAAEMLKRLAQNQPRAFVHWSLGYLT